MFEDQFDMIKINHEEEIYHVITEKDVEDFSKLTGDDNPLHMDEKFASETSFRNRVVHGMLTASFLSTIVGTKLPGKGALWYEQNLRFLAPVRIGEKIRAWAKIKHKSYSQRTLVLETVIFGEDGRKVIEGEGKVKVLRIEKRKGEAMSEEDHGAVIVSGASRGIGAAVAKELASAGYPVIVNYHTSKEEALRVVSEIEKEGYRAVAIKANVTDDNAIRMMVEDTLETFGKIGGVVNNAAAKIEPIEFEHLGWKHIQEHLDVQIKGSFQLCQAVIPHFLANRYGIIVNIASIVADNIPPIRQLPYTLAKSALIGFSKSLAAEYGPHGVRVNTVSPGMTNTDLIADFPEKAKMVNKMQTPLRRLADPEDISGMVAFLFSHKARHITGQNIRICGGAVMN